jgi:hypothetical protein
MQAAGRLAPMLLRPAAGVVTATTASAAFKGGRLKML